MEGDYPRYPRVTWARLAARQDRVTPDQDAGPGLIAYELPGGEKKFEQKNDCDLLKAPPMPPP